MTNNTHQTLLDRLEKIPPFVVYALARKRGHKSIDFNTIMAKSSLTGRTLSRIANRTTWRGLKIEQIDAFCTACRVDPFAAKKHLAFLNRSMTSDKPLPHLPVRRLRIFAAKCRKWKEAQAKASA